MGDYNFKSISFNNSVQYRIYKNVVKEGYERQVSFPCDSDGVMIEKERTEKDIEKSLYSSINRTKNKIYEYAKSNDWEWFLTFTFDKNVVDRYDYKAVSRKMIFWLNNVKKLHCPDMKYIIVPEFHKDGAVHFHGLLSNCDGLDFIDSGHMVDGEVIYNVSSYGLGFTTATKVRDSLKVSGYICKYITKELCSMGKGFKRYWASRNLNKPVVEKRFIGGNEKFYAFMELAGDASYLKMVKHPWNEVTYLEFDHDKGGILDEVDSGM